MVVLTDEKSPIKNNLKLPSPYFLWRKLTYVSRNGRHYSYTYWVLMKYLHKGSGIHEVFKPKGFLGRVDKMSPQEAIEAAWDRIGDAKEGIPIPEPSIDIEIVEVKPDNAEDLVVEIEGKVLGGYCPHKLGHCYYLEDGEFCGCESTIDQRVSIRELEGCRFFKKKEVAA